MNAFKYLMKIADKFSKKLSLGQTISDDPRAITSDAFFGPGQETIFQRFILKPTSNFSKVLPETIKLVNIGAAINAKNRTANFLVSTTPPAGQLSNTLINALKNDYKAFYGQFPEERFAA